MSEHLASLRQHNKSKLTDLAPKVRGEFSKIITDKIVASDYFVQSQNIACYIPFEYEVDVWPIIKIIWQRGKNCYLPIISDTIERQLDFVNFLPNDELYMGKYKALEPKFSQRKIILAKNLDLVIVPMIGFNQNNFRLGRGKGYYDYTFAFKKANNCSKPSLVGVAYRCQQVEFIPNSWDIPMDGIVTE